MRHDLKRASDKTVLQVLSEINTAMSFEVQHGYTTQSQSERDKTVAGNEGVSEAAFTKKRKKKDVIILSNSEEIRKHSSFYGRRNDSL